MERNYTRGEICDIVGIGKHRFHQIMRQGCVRVEYSDGEPGNYRIRTDALELVNHGSERPYVYPQKTLDAFLEGVYPDRHRWVASRRLCIQAGISRTCISRYYLKGRIRGRKSFTFGRLYIHPDDAYSILLYHKYNVVACLRRLGAAPTAIKSWNKASKRRFLQKSAVVPSDWVVLPWICGRLRMLYETKPMTREKLSHLFDSKKDFGDYLRKLESFEKRKGALMRDYNLRNCVRNLGISWHTMYIWNNKAAKPFIKVLRHQAGNMAYLEPWMLGRLRMLKKMNPNGRVTEEMLSHLFDGIMDFRCYLNGWVNYNPNTPPSYDECAPRKRFYYKGIGLGTIVSRAREDSRAVVDVRFRAFIDELKQVRFKIKQ